MNRWVMAALMSAVLLAAPVLAADEATPAPTPTEVTKTFMRAVIDKKRDVLGKVFDYEFALDEINRVFESQGAGRPYDMETIKDTLYYYFTADKQKKAMGELDRPNTAFAEGIDEERGFAVVDITKPDVREGDVYKDKVRVGLRKVQGQWKIQVFPQFYPLNVSQINTGT
jgi:hypothetical protein